MVHDDNELEMNLMYMENVIKVLKICKKMNLLPLHTIKHYNISYVLHLHF